MPPRRVEAEGAEHKHQVGPLEPVVEDARQAVGEDERDGEGVEEQPGQEVGAPPKLQPTKCQEVHEGGQRGEHGHGEACKREGAFIFLTFHHQIHHHQRQSSFERQVPLLFGGLMLPNENRTTQNAVTDVYSG